MRFAFSEDQMVLRSAVRDVLEKECTPTDVRAALEGVDARSGPRWAKLAEVGVVGLTVPEDAGGMGMDALDLVQVLEECGRVALPDPVVETTAVGVPLLVELAPADVRDRWLPAIAAGEAVVATGLDGSPYVSGGPGADLYLLRHADEIHAVPADAVTPRVEPSLDAGRPLLSISWTPSAATCLVTGDEGRTAAEAAFDRGALGSAAQLLGVAQQIIDMATSYARTRVQFGQPIGSFQAVKHMLAGALLQLEFARPVVYRAAYSISPYDADSTCDGDAPIHVSMAKAYASDAAILAARVGLQVHGAIGYTWEHDLQLWMKRAWALAAAWGDARWHRARVAGHLLGSPSA